MAKLSSLRGMQDAREKDMFHLSNSNYLRYNGHVQVSSGGKGGKKERKGCTKGKLEAVMRNSSFGQSVISATNMTVSSMTNSHGNHFIRASHSVKPSQVDQDDPYTFTEAEPQLTTYYPAGSSNITVKKPARTNENARRVSTEGGARRPSADSSSLARRVGIDPVTRRPLETPPKPPPKPRPPENNTSKMNKLQAEFARNKVMGKRRKVDQPPTPKWEPTQKRVSNRVLIANRKVPRKTTWQREKKARHELLERIEEAKIDWENINQDIFPLGVEVSDTEDESEDSQSVYERHWFARCSGAESREDRVTAARAELRRELSQAMRGVSLAESSPTDLLRSVISAARVLPNSAANLLDSALPPPTSTARYINKISKGGMFLVRGEKCSYWEGCSEQALPCTRHCCRHIMYNVDQRLFSRCTAKSMDNTQCNIPVVDVVHHLPLCPLHAHQHERYNALSSEAKNKKMSKKSRVVGISRSSKRSQKKKKKVNVTGSSGSVEEMVLSGTFAAFRPDMDIEITQGLEDGHTTIHIPEPPEDPVEPTEHIVQAPIQTHLPPPAPPPPVVQPPSLVEVGPISVDGEVPEEVLEIASLDPIELAHQATRLLEEHDLTNVLNQIPPDTFNELFAGFTSEDKNGGYEPTREETEELDRALEAVDNDVRSLERSMTTQLPSLLDSFLDDPHLSFPSTDIQPSS